MSVPSDPLTEWDGEETRVLAGTLGLPALEVHRSLPSTSDRARALWEEDQRFWRVVVADEQTAGRGRRGRAWSSPPGAGVWLSVALPAHSTVVDGLLPLRIGIALARTLAAEAAPGAIGIKWPNDLLAAGPDGSAGKVGGILCERIRGGSGAYAVIVGVGLNVLRAPDATDPHPNGFPPAPLSGVLPGLGRTRALHAVVEAVRTARAHVDATLSQVELARWSALDTLAGQRVRVEGGGAGALAGTVRGLDAAGRLLLDTGGGILPVVSGTVRPE